MEESLSSRSEMVSEAPPIPENLWATNGCVKAWQTSALVVKPLVRCPRFLKIALHHTLVSSPNETQCGGRGYRRGPGWKEEGISGVGGTREGDGDKCD